MLMQSLYWSNSYARIVNQNHTGLEIFKISHNTDVDFENSPRKWLRTFECVTLCVVQPCMILGSAIFFFFNVGTCKSHGKIDFFRQTERFLETTMK